MPSTPIEFDFPAGQTLAVDLFAAPAGGAAIASALAATEQTAPGTYRITHSGAQTGVLKGIIKIGGTRAGAFFVHVAADDTTVYVAVDSYLEALNLDAKVSDVPAAVDTELTAQHGAGSWETGEGGGAGGGEGAHELVFDVQIDGSPIPDADVVITQVNSAIDENVVDARRSNANASVTFPGIDAGIYWVHVQKVGVISPAAPVKLTVVDGDNFSFAAV